MKSYPGITAGILIVLLMPVAGASAQLPAPDSADVRSVVALVEASYQTMNGPAGTPRQWHRDSSLYMPGATFMALAQSGGEVNVTRLTADEYRQAQFPRFEKSGLYETEIGRRIERFGNVAQVRSVAVARRTLDGPIEARFVNYFQVYFDGQRWWIAGMVWDEERPDDPIPTAWIGRWETTAK